MSTPPIDSPVSSFEVRCRVGQFVMDSDDPDRAPDLVPVGGTVTIEPDLRRPIRVHGENGPRVVGVDALEFTIDPATGKLVHPDGEPGVELIDPTDEHLDPQGWTYTANVRPEKGRSWTVTFGAPTDGGIVDLGGIVPVSPSPGVTENHVQQAIAARDASETFAVRAETAATEAEDYAPSFDWDGTRLVIDGDTGPDLEGPAGPSVEGIGDVPGLQDVIDRLTYDSGWRALPLGQGWTGTVLIKRYGVMVEVLIGGIMRGEDAGPVAFTLPAGFRPYSAGAASLRPPVTTASSPPVIERTFISGGASFQVLSNESAGATLYGSFTFTTTHPVPSTPPGTPA